MKEDVLEQIVDDHLKADGYFTMHNVRFRPRPDSAGYDKRADSSPSDIDVIGIGPRKSGPPRVKVVTCKSWQNGFDASWWAANVSLNTRIAGRPCWKFFRELVVQRWAESFMAKIEEMTGTREFTYVTAVTKLRGDRKAWELNPALQRKIDGNPIEILTLEEIYAAFATDDSTTPAASEIGRLVQLLKAAQLLE